VRELARLAAAQPWHRETGHDRRPRGRGRDGAGCSSTASRATATTATTAPSGGTVGAGHELAVRQNVVARVGRYGVRLGAAVGRVHAGVVDRDGVVAGSARDVVGARASRQAVAAGAARQVLEA